MSFFLSVCLQNKLRYIFVLIGLFVHLSHWCNKCPPDYSSIQTIIKQMADRSFLRPTENTRISKDFFAEYI